MSGCGTGVTGVAMPAGVSWDAGAAGGLAWGGQPFGKGAVGAQVPGKGFGTAPGKGFGTAPGKGFGNAPGKGLGSFPGKGAQKPVWQPTPGGGLAKQYPPGQVGIPYAWHPGYGIVQ